MPSVEVQPVGTQPAPAEWDIPDSATAPLQVCFAHFDGSAAAGSFKPTLEIVSNVGATIATITQDQAVAAGDSADATWAPFLDSPGVVAAYARVTTQEPGDPAVHVNAGASIVLPWYHFYTTDPAVFATTPGGPPNNQPGDTLLLMQQPGFYVARSFGQMIGSGFERRFALSWGNNAPAHFTPVWSPANDFLLPAAPPGTQWINDDWAVIPAPPPGPGGLLGANLPYALTLEATNNSGVTKQVAWSGMIVGYVSDQRFPTIFY